MDPSGTRYSNLQISSWELRMQINRHLCVRVSARFLLPELFQTFTVFEGESKFCPKVTFPCVYLLNTVCKLWRNSSWFSNSNFGL